MKPRILLLALALLTPLPAGAEETVAEPAATAPANDIQLDKETARGMLSFADITLQFAGKPQKGQDRVVYLKRRDDGELVTSGIAGPASAAQTPFIEDSLGAVRMRYNMPKKADAPLGADADFVAEYGQSLIVVHVRKKRRWEIGRVGGKTVYRPLGQNGSPGDWEQFPKM